MDVVAAGAAGWEAVEPAFAPPGDAAGCWCRWFRVPGRRFESEGRGQRRDALRAEVAEGAGGVVAIEDGVTVGWCGVGPREGYPRLLRSPLLRGLDAPAGVWAVTCFVVPAPHRGRGVASALLAGAVAHARASGARVVEGYPVDVATREHVAAGELYHGPLTLFERAGFDVVTRPTASRAVVRLDVAASPRAVQVSARSKT